MPRHKVPAVSRIDVSIRPGAKKASTNRNTFTLGPAKASQTLSLTSIRPDYAGETGPFDIAG